MKNILQVIIGIVVVAALAILAYKFLYKPATPNGMTSFQGMIAKRKVHLVEYQYNDVIFLHKKDDGKKKLLMIVKYPVTVSASIDLKELEVDTLNKKIKLPSPKILEPNLMLQSPNTEFMPIRNGFLISFGGTRSDLLESLKNRLFDSSDRIKVDAINRGILTQAKKEAEGLVGDLFEHFTQNYDYEVTFAESEAMASLASFQPEFGLKMKELAADGIQLIEDASYINIEELNLKAIDWQLIQLDEKFILENEKSIIFN